MREHGGAGGEHERAAREHEEAVREQMNKTCLTGGAKRRDLSQRPITCWPEFDIYIYT